MMVDRNHPKYAEYREKCEDLAKRQRVEADSVPYSGGQDGPLGDVYRKYSAELKRLKHEYSFLFAEDSP